MRRYILWWCPFTYDNTLIFIMFYIKMSRIFSSLKNIKSVNLWKFWTHLFRSSQGNPQPLILNQQGQVHSKTEHYQGSDDRSEVNIDSYINCLASGNLQKYTTVPSQCEPLTWTWRWCLLYFDHLSHFKNCPGSI